MGHGKINYLCRESDGTLQIKTLEITSYEIPQLDRIEKKVDRILELLEGQELSTSFDNLEIGKLSDLPNDAVKLLNLDKRSI